MNLLLVDHTELAPIALFVYNRPLHTRRTLESLRTNELSEKSELFIFSDGPTEDASSQTLNDINHVQEIIREQDWCSKVTIIESPSNKGLTKSVIDGVSHVLNKYEKIIVLEDDLILSKHFLSFMNRALALYEKVSNVYSVNGYMFPIPDDEPKTVLMPLFFTWGWATWRKKWECFRMDPEQNKLLLSNNHLRNRFNLADYDYSSMLETAKNSWGIHWYFSIFQRNGLVVFPTTTLVRNIGFDGSGVNCGNVSIATDCHHHLDAKVPVALTDKIDFKFYGKLLDFFSDSSQQTLENNPVQGRLMKLLGKLF
jgi:glycosyltransferase involved in cell wall biosynthesis